VGDVERPVVQLHPATCSRTSGTTSSFPVRACLKIDRAPQAGCSGYLRAQSEERYSQFDRQLGIRG